MKDNKVKLILSKCFLSLDDAKRELEYGESFDNPNIERGKAFEGKIAFIEQIIDIIIKDSK